VRSGGITLHQELCEFGRRIGAGFHDGFVTTVMPDGVMKWFRESGAESNPMRA
jgi:hypothetical protein